MGVRGVAALGLTILLLGSWLLVARLAQFVHSPRGAGVARVDVPPGSGAAGVLRAFDDAGLVDWSAGVRWGMRFWADPSRLKAGTYSFPSPVRWVDIFADLEAGRVELVEVTIPEGLTAREMARILGESGVTSEAGFVRVAYDSESVLRWDVPAPTLEGYLFPDTYRFARGLPPERVVDAMIARFRTVTSPLTAVAREQGLDLNQWVTLASIVEKETGAAEERPLISAVFLNRLRRGMRLESDPTVIYAMGDFDGNLVREDLRRDSPYNTYVRKGLPPGPIANPGRSCLGAILNPAEVSYLYFVSRNDGSHVFSETYEEHRGAVDRFQRRGRR